MSGRLHKTRDMKFLHTSDWQIGKTWSRLPAEAQARFDAARLAAIKRLGKLAVEQGCSFIVVAGDVFEHNSLREETLGRAKEALRALPVPVVLLPGNHDPLTADSIFSQTQDLKGVSVIKDMEPFSPVPGVEIVGAPLVTRHPSQDLAAAALAGLGPQRGSNGPRIVIAHGQTQGYGAAEGPALLDLATMEQALEQGIVDYIALGDTHSTQQVGSTGKIFYSGSPEVTDFHDLDTGGGENNSGNALVVEVTPGPSGIYGDGPSTVRTTCFPVGEWTFETFKEEVSAAADVQRFIRRLEDYPEKQDTVVKYSLVGTLSLEDMQVLRAELERLQPIFAALYPRERTSDLRVQPTPEDIASLNFTGFAQDVVAELTARLEADEADAVAQEALFLLYRLANAETGDK